MILKTLKANREIIIPIVFSILFLIFLFFLLEPIYLIFLEGNIGEMIINVGIALTGFILTAYTVFLGFLVYLSDKIGKTPVPEKINFRFKFSIYLSIFLLFGSMLFQFFKINWIPPILLSITLLLLLMMLKLIGYLNILFKDIRNKIN